MIRAITQGSAHNPPGISTLPQGPSSFPSAGVRMKVTPSSWEGSLAKGKQFGVTRDPTALTICGVTHQQGKFWFKNYCFSLHLLLLAAQEEEDGGTHIIHLPTPSHPGQGQPQGHHKGCSVPPWPPLLQPARSSLCVPGSALITSHLQLSARQSPRSVNPPTGGDTGVTPGWGAPGHPTHPSELPGITVPFISSSPPLPPAFLIP